MCNESLTALLVSAASWHKHYDLVESEELLKGIFWGQLTALLRHDIVEVTRLHQLGDDVKATLELAMNVDLRESRPLSVELEPLADAFVAQDIKRLDVAVTTSVDMLNKATSELALRSVQCSFNEHHARVVLDEVVDFAESKLLLLLKESLDKSVKLGDFFGQLIWRDT